MESSNSFRAGPEFPGEERGKRVQKEHDVEDGIVGDVGHEGAAGNDIDD
jgi:hypothetical protein